MSLEEVSHPTGFRWLQENLRRVPGSRVAEVAELVDGTPQIVVAASKPYLAVEQQSESTHWLALVRHADAAGTLTTRLPSTRRSYYMHVVVPANYQILIDLRQDLTQPIVRCGGVRISSSLPGPGGHILSDHREVGLNMYKV